MEADLGEEDDLQEERKPSHRGEADLGGEADL